MTTRRRRNYVPDPTAAPLEMSQFPVIYPHRQWSMKTWGELVRRDEILLVASGDEKPWGQPGLDYGGDGFDFERWGAAIDSIFEEGLEGLSKRTRRLRRQAERLAVEHPWDKEFLLAALVDAIGEARITVAEMMSGSPRWERLTFAGSDFWKTLRQIPEWKESIYAAIKGKTVEAWNNEALFGVANSYISWINASDPLDDVDMRLRFMDDLRPIAQELADRRLVEAEWWGALYER